MLEIKDLTHWYGPREPEHQEHGQQEQGHEEQGHEEQGHEEQGHEEQGHEEPGQLALDGISLRVADGELVSIVGPSGCGKSTLLRCVAGLLTPASGAVLLDGAPVDRVPDGLAVVFQDYSRSLLPWLSVQDNVGLPLRKKAREGPAGRRVRSGGRWRRGRCRQSG